MFAQMQHFYRQQKSALAEGASAGARLLRLELVYTRQAQALIAAERQITKLNTRARLLGRDLQPPLRQVCPAESCSKILMCKPQPLHLVRVALV